MRNQIQSFTDHPVFRIPYNFGLTDKKTERSKRTIQTTMRPKWSDRKLPDEYFDACFPSNSVQLGPTPSYETLERIQPLIPRSTRVRQVFILPLPVSGYTTILTPCYRGARATAAVRGDSTGPAREIDFLSSFTKQNKGAMCFYVHSSLIF